MAKTGFALGVDVRDPQTTPEPATLFLFGAGLLGLACIAGRRGA